MGFFAGIIFIIGVPLVLCLPSRLNSMTQEEDEGADEVEDVPFLKFFTGRKPFIIAFTLLNTFMCFIWFEPTLAVHVTGPEHNFTKTEASNCFTLVGFTFGIASPLIGCLCEYVNPSVIYGTSVFFIAIADFFTGPSSVIFPNDAWLILLGLALVGITVGGAFVPSIPMLIEAVHEKCNDDKEAEGKEKSEEPSPIAADKASALAMMCFSFG